MLENSKKKLTQDPADSKPAEPEPQKDPAASTSEEQEPQKNPNEPQPAEQEQQKDSAESDPADQKSGNGEDETAQLRQQLLAAKAENAAYKAGVRADAVEDAVVLAMHAVARSGEQPTEESIHAALGDVLTRHPDWKSASVPTPPNKVGAPAPGTESISEEDLYLKKKYANNPYYQN